MSLTGLIVDKNTLCICKGHQTSASTAGVPMVSIQNVRQRMALGVLHECDFFQPVRILDGYNVPSASY